MLCRIGEVGGVEGRGKDGVRGDMVAPGIECDAPRVCVGIGSKGSEFFVRRMVEKPRGVLGADRSVGGFNLAVVEDGFAEEEVAARSPGEVVKRMVGVLTAESGEEDLAVIHFPVAITISEVGQVRFFRAIHAAISIKDERERDVQVSGPGGALVGFSILVGVFENDDFITGLLSGIDVRISHGGGNPEASAIVPTHLDGAGHFGEVFFGSETVYLETRVDFEGFEFVGNGEEFVSSS